MSVTVPIVAGTAIRGIAATLMMRRVLERHPEAFLITLASFGVTIPLHKSQEHIERDIHKGLLSRGLSTDSPVVLVGHSQGALASLRYALDHPHQVLHVISVGAPWRGSFSAGRMSRMMRWTRVDIAPALTDMAEGSVFLTRLHEDLPVIADRVTNIYSTHEIFINPYTDAHIDIPGVENILIATLPEYKRHLAACPQFPVDGHIEGRINHLEEMSSPDVRAVIWDKVQQISDRVASEQDDGEGKPA